MPLTHRRFLVPLVLAAWCGEALAQQPPGPGQASGTGSPGTPAGGAAATAPSFQSLPELGPTVRRGRAPDRLVTGVEPVAKLGAAKPIPFVPLTLADLRRFYKNDALALDSPMDVSVRKLVRRGPGGSATTLRQPERLRLPASEVLKNLNAYEQRLNARGQTLRDPSTRKAEQSQIATERLAGRTAAARAKFTPVGPGKKRFEPARLALMRQSQLAHMGRAAGIAKKVADAKKSAGAPSGAAPAAGQGQQPAGPVNLTPLLNRWEESFGDPGVVSVDVSGDLKVEGTPTEVKTVANARATATMFGRSQEFVALTAGAQAHDGSTPNSQQLTLSMKVLGIDLTPPVNKQGAGAIEQTDAAELTLNPRVEIPFTIGPVPMKVTFGALGTVGFRYALAASPLYVRAVAEPFTSLDAYVEVAVDAYVAEVGVGGSLTLLDENLELAAMLKIDDDGAGGAPRYTWSYNGYNDLRLLDGEVYVFARVDYVVDEAEWRWTVFSWNGFRIEGFLFDQTSSMDFAGNRGPELTTPDGPYLRGNQKCSGCFPSSTNVTCDSCPRLNGGARQDVTLALPCNGYIQNHDGVLQCLPAGTYLADCVEACFLDPSLGGFLHCTRCKGSAGTGGYPDVGPHFFRDTALSAPCLEARVGTTRRVGGDVLNGNLECITPGPPPPSPPPACTSPLRCCFSRAGVCAKCVGPGDSCFPNLALRVGPVAAAAANAASLAMPTSLHGPGAAQGAGAPSSSPPSPPQVRPGPQPPKVPSASSPPGLTPAGPRRVPGQR